MVDLATTLERAIGQAVESLADDYQRSPLRPLVDNLKRAKEVVVEVYGLDKKVGTISDLDDLSPQDADIRLNLLESRLN